MPAFDTAAVADWLRITDEQDLADLELVCAAVVSFIDSLPDAPRANVDEWADRTHLAARMLAARLFRRRNSPSGIEGFTADGATTAYVSRYDPDIARMLRLDGFAPPRVG